MQGAHAVMRMRPSQPCTQEIHETAKPRLSPGLYCSAAKTAKWLCDPAADDPPVVTGSTFPHLLRISAAQALGGTVEEINLPNYLPAFSTNALV